MPSTPLSLGVVFPRGSWSPGWESGCWWACTECELLSLSLVKTCNALNEVVEAFGANLFLHTLPKCRGSMWGNSAESRGGNKPSLAQATDQLSSKCCSLQVTDTLLWGSACLSKGKLLVDPHSNRSSLCRCLLQPPCQQRGPPTHCQWK